MEQGRLIQQAGFMYETEGFKQRNSFRAPPRAARRHGTLLLPLQRFPGYFAEEGAALWTDIVYLEPVGQLLQLLRNLGGLLRPEVDADDGRANGYQQNPMSTPMMPGMAKGRAWNKRVLNWLDDCMRIFSRI